jgi:8-oxo-dGTP diphosphatase
MNFHGAKVALLCEGRLLMHLRDNKPGLFNANMWDFPGGGRESEETPQECVIREVKEEFEIELSPQSFLWEKEYPAQKDPNQKAYFMVAEISKEQVEKIKLNEGQEWALFNKEDFFQRDDVIDALKNRFKDYLDFLQKV